MQRLLFGTSPEALTTTASLSHLFSVAVSDRELSLAVVRLWPRPLPLSWELIGWCCTALHCRWGMTPTPPLHQSKITLFLVCSNTKILIIDPFNSSSGTPTVSLYERVDSHAAHPHHSLSRVCSHLDRTWDAFIQYSVRQKSIPIQNRSKLGKILIQGGYSVNFVQSSRVNYYW